MQATHIRVSLLKNELKFDLDLDLTLTLILLSVCLSVQTITFELLHMRNFIFSMEVHHWPYLGQVWVSTSLGQVQGRCAKMIIHLFQLVIPLYVPTGH